MHACLTTECRIAYLQGMIQGLIELASGPNAVKRPTLLRCLRKIEADTADLLQELRKQPQLQGEEAVF